MRPADGSPDRAPAAVTPARWTAAAGLTFVAVALAWGGQGLTTRSLPDSLSALAFFSRFLPVYRNSRELSAAFVLMFAGALILGLVSLRRGDETDRDLISTTRPLGVSSAVDALLLLGVFIGLGLWWVFLLALHDHEYSHQLNLALLVAVLFVAAPLFKRDFVHGRLRCRPQRALVLHLLFVGAVFGAFLYINARDLTSWKYSAIGDEYSNFGYAASIARGAAFNPWSHVGPDNLGAVAGSAGQALFMRIGNQDNFAWKFYNVFITALALIPFYFLVRQLLGARRAVMATLFLAFSHYVLGYAHHDLRLDAMLPTALGLCLLVVGLRRDSALALFAAGIALALGFYTFESGRAAVVIAALFMLTFGVRAFRPAILLPLAAGFIMFVLPLFATDGVHHVIRQMTGQTAIDYSEAVTGDRWERLRVNAQYSLVSFNFQRAGAHYVWGSLVDPLTAMLFIPGIGVAVMRLKRPAYRLILIWLAVEVAMNGLTNPYPRPPITRLPAAVPPIAVLAAIAVDAIIRPFTDLSPVKRFIGDRSWRLATSGLVIAALLPAILYLNLHRFLYEMPRNLGSGNNAIAVRGVMSDECRHNRYGTLLISHSPGPLFALIFSSYRIEDRNLMLLRYADAFTVLGTSSADAHEPPPPDEAGKLLPQIPFYPYDESIPLLLARNREGDYLGYGCVVAVADDERFQEFVDTMRARYPAKTIETLTDLGGQHGPIMVMY
jgi:Dolichyl-phosphate-mannose-protein mannosyltransferase